MKTLLFPIQNKNIIAGVSLKENVEKVAIAQHCSDFFDFNDFSYLNQIHSGEVVFAENPVKGEDGDALLTFEKNIMLCVFTADCVPVYIYGDNFVGIIHAGWRGFVNGIFENFFNILQDKNVNFSQCKAIIGASICGKCYEVGNDVAEKFDSRFLKRKNNGKFILDLKKCAFDILTGYGIFQKNIYLSDLCTFHQTCFNSYRRDKTAFRNVNFIGIKGEA